MAEPSNSSPAKLDENHRRSISITLQLVDKALGEWDNWTKGQVQSGVMYRQRDTFSPAQKSELRSKIAKIRQLMARLRDDLQLEISVVTTSQSIVGQAGLLWEMLLELDLERAVEQLPKTRCRTRTRSQQLEKPECVCN